MKLKFININIILFILIGNTVAQYSPSATLVEQSNEFMEYFENDDIESLKLLLSKHGYILSNEKDNYRVDISHFDKGIMFKKYFMIRQEVDSEKLVITKKIRDEGDEIDLFFVQYRDLSNFKSYYNASKRYIKHNLDDYNFNNCGNLAAALRTNTYDNNTKYCIQEFEDTSRHGGSYSLYVIPDVSKLNLNGKRYIKSGETTCSSGLSNNKAQITTKLQFVNNINYNKKAIQSGRIYNCKNFPEQFNSYEEAINTITNSMDFKIIDMINTSKSQWIKEAKYFSCDVSTRATTYKPHPCI